jgi:quercetin dioxygenase-like cupin family protein
VQYARGRSDEPAEPGTKVCATVGGVLIDNLLRDDNVSVNGAVFQPGARTFWHSHADGQVFIIGSGRGVIANRDGDARVVQAGDVLYAPPGEEHWHGAAPDAFLTYTSVSLGQTHFGPEVDDAEYDLHW